MRDRLRGEEELERQTEGTRENVCERKKRGEGEGAKQHIVRLSEGERMGQKFISASFDHLRPLMYSLRVNDCWAIKVHCSLPPPVIPVPALPTTGRTGLTGTHIPDLSVDTVDQCSKALVWNVPAFTNPPETS